MALYARASQVAGPPDGVPRRPEGRRNAVSVTSDSALRHSAVWACLMLRADLESSMPVETYRKVGAVNVEVPRPPVFEQPGGPDCPWPEWAFSSRVDLDRAGNACGIITARDGMGFPARVELQPLDQTSIRIKDNRVQYFTFGGRRYEPHEVWHERQYTVAGLPVGLSPVTYAAWSISQYLSAQDFALDWFSGGAVPAVELHNKAKKITPTDADTARDQYRRNAVPGGVLVTGADWEFRPISAVSADTNWINTQQYGVSDIARFFGAPSDLIESAVSGQSITYANISQRNLQFLITKLGPAIYRREYRWSLGWLPRPRFVKLNTDAILRMDPETRARVMGQQVRDRLRVPSEVRAKDDLAPFTDEQLFEFDRLFGRPKTEPTTSQTGAVA